MANLETISISTSYCIDYQGIQYMIVSAWDDTTNFQEFTIYDENNKVVDDENLVEKITEEFEKDININKEEKRKKGK